MSEIILRNKTNRSTKTSRSAGLLAGVDDELLRSLRARRRGRAAQKPKVQRTKRSNDLTEIMQADDLTLSEVLFDDEYDAPDTLLAAEKLQEGDNDLLWTTESLGDDEQSEVERQMSFDNVSIENNDEEENVSSTAGGGVNENTSSTVRVIPRRRALNADEALRKISNPSIRRLARRGGCKRVGKDVYREAKSVLQTYLSNIIEKLPVVAEYMGRPKTIKHTDVRYVLGSMKSKLYGFDEQ